jgi:aspartate-semialdehyde dehydrogenase
MKVAFIGWRGMVGSVLMERMHQEQDFDGLEARFFSTSNPGAEGPDGRELLDAHDLGALAAHDVVVTCQGGAWTRRIYPALRERWQGHWIDAASVLRMESEAVIVLDPVNGQAVQIALADGTRTWVGANCTVSLMLMGIVGLLRTGHVKWVSSMTYQAASGAGARNLRELVDQMRHIGDATATLLDDPSTAALALDRRVAETRLPMSHFGAPLATSALPWVDCAVEDGQTREEWKAMVEANKILGTRDLAIDGICVRIGALRCHAQALTIELDRDLPIQDIEDLIASAHEWVDVVPNEKQATLARLTPAAVAGTLRVPVGRLRKMKMGPTFVTCFTVGDQLLWGAAEPLRRMLRVLAVS